MTKTKQTNQKKKQDETNEAKNKSKKSSNFITIAIAYVYLETLCFNLFTIPLTTGKKKTSMAASEMVTVIKLNVFITYFFNLLIIIFA